MELIQDYRAYEKKILRQIFKDKRKNLNRTIRQKEEALVLDLLFNSELWKNSEALFFYLAIGDEFPLGKAIEQAFVLGKKVFLPRVLDKRKMVFLPFKQGDKLLTSSMYGLLEPCFQDSETCQMDLTLFHENDLMVLPSLALDRSGVRLGYGGGYYDTFLGEIPFNLRPKLLGLNYASLFVESLPSYSTDIVCDVLLHPYEGLIKLSSR